MARENGSELAPLIDEIMTALMDELTDGFTPDQVEWVLRVMRDTILPYQLRFALGEDDGPRRQRAAVIQGDLAEALEGKGARERWRAIQQMHYVARMLPISDQAFALARGRMEAGEVSADVRAKAVALRSTAEQVVEEMGQHAPYAQEALSGVISETMVDCAYASGEVELMSLRLGAIHRQAEAGSANCPACGAANEAGSRFCSSCGKPLGGNP